MAARPNPLKRMAYSDVRDSIHTGYLAVSYGDGPVPQIIQRKTGGPSHVMVCGWEAEGRVLMVAESTTPESRVVCLSSVLEESSGDVDLYRLRPEVDALVDHAALWEWLLRGTGQEYAAIVLAHDWLVLMGADPPHYPNSDDPTTRRVCSQFAHAGFRVNGMPPMAESDCDVYPVHFTDPRWCEYLATPTLP